MKKRIITRDTQRSPLEPHLELTVAAHEELLVLDMLGTLEHDLSLNITLHEHARCTVVTIMRLSGARGLYTVNTNARGAQVSSTITLLQQLDASDITINFIDQAHAHSSTQFIHHALLDNGSRVQLNGMLSMPSVAHKARASQKSSILLLDTASRAQTMPALEIAHHELSCTHGSAIGTLSADELWYAAARGLDKQVLKSLICAQFLPDYIDQQPLPVAVREKIKHRLSESFL